MEKEKEKPKNETYKTKFRLLAIVSMIQTVVLWYVVNTGFGYHFSILENVLVATIVIIFYILLFAKTYIQAFINKILDW